MLNAAAYPSKSLLKPGFLKIRMGDMVTFGHAVGSVGNTSEPHLIHMPSSAARPPSRFQATLCPSSEGRFLVRNDRFIAP